MFLIVTRDHHDTPLQLQVLLFYIQVVKLFSGPSLSTSHYF